MKFITTILVALLISANLQAENLPLSNQKHFGSKTALLVFFDIAGLNNYNSNNNTLAKKVKQSSDESSKSRLFV